MTRDKIYFRVFTMKGKLSDIILELKIMRILDNLANKL